MIPLLSPTSALQQQDFPGLERCSDLHVMVILHLHPAAFGSAMDDLAGGCQAFLRSRPRPQAGWPQCAVVGDPLCEDAIEPLLGA